MRIQNKCYFFFEWPYGFRHKVVDLTYYLAMLEIVDDEVKKVVA